MRLTEARLDRITASCGASAASRLIEEYGADMGLPDLWESLAGDCPNAHTTALNNRCAIYYPQLPALFLPGKET